MQKNDSKTKKKLSKGAKTAIIIASVTVGIIVLILAAIYIFATIIYPEVQPADTTIHDLAELAEIFDKDLDANVEGFTQNEIDQARRQIIIEKVELLPYKDYETITTALYEDINADLSEYGFTTYQEQLVRWAVRLDLDFYLFDIEPSGDETTTSPDTSKEPETTNSPETSKEPETTKTPETTKSPETTSPIEPSISVNPTPDTEPAPITGQTITDNDIYNVLIIGLDTRGTDFGGRSDTIIVMSVNRVSKRIILTSFQRDTIIKNPETNRYVKINTFYANGRTVGEGAGKLINALKYNFDITIHNYVVVNFVAFKEIINIFGGVEVPLYYGEYNYLKARYPATHETPVVGLDDLYTDKANGFIWVTLNADQALVYARMRKGIWNPATGKLQRCDDGYRTERQRWVIHGLMRAARRMTFDQLMDICNKVFNYIVTDLPLNEFLVKIMGYTDFAKYSTHMLNASGIRYSWYPCSTDGLKVYFAGDAGYGGAGHITGVGILEYPYCDGYAIIKSTWREMVYK